jgi:osmoprotectant transport system permease protein
VTAAVLVLAQSGRPFPDWGWLARNAGRLQDQFLEHVLLTVLAVAIGFAVAAPLAVLAVRRRRLYAPLLNVTGILYTIPSLAMFAMFVVVGLGLSYRSALTGLVVYSLLILFRNNVAALDSVAPDVREAAEAMGYTPTQRLLRVDVPVALPVVIAGIRIATVTTIGLVTITAVIGLGGLGRFFYVDGFQRGNYTALAVGFTGSVGLAVVADLALVALERALTPWSRQRTVA